MKKKEKFIVRALKGIGYSVLSEILCAVLVMSLIVFVRKIFVLKVVLAVCTLIITLGLYFNWAYKAARLDRDMVKFHGMEYDRYMPLKMALVGPIISYISIIVLFLSYIGVIPDIFNFYLLFNMFVLPAVDAFTNGRTLEVLTVPGFLGIFALVLTQPAAIAASYIMVYKDVDIVKKVFYKDH